VARNFNGSSYLDFSAGGAPPNNHFTWAALYRPTVVTGTKTLLAIGFSSPGGNLRILSGALTASIGGTAIAPAVSIPITLSDGWCIAALTKPLSGSAPFRFHLYKYDTDTWLREDSATTTGGSGAARSEIRIGDSTSGGERFTGDMAAVGMFDTALSDDQLSTLPYSLNAWLSARPTVMFVFDQHATTQTVRDWTGGGANQTGITGTTVSTVSVPILTYGHPVILPTRTGGAPAAVPISTVSDNFDDNAVDPTLWSGDSGTVGESGGVATITADTGYNAKRTGSVYTFDDAYSKVNPFPAGTSTGAAMDWGVASAAEAAGTDLVFYLDVVAGTLYFANRVGYTDGGATSVTYNSTSHAWWRLQRSAGNVLWQTSPDGATWTTQRTLTEPSWVSANPADISFHSEAHRNDGSGGGATLDNFNVAPAATTANAGQAAVGVDAHNATTATAVTATAGVAQVGVNGYNPAPVLTSTATAGQADVTATGHDPAAVTTSQTTANAGTADVGVDAYSASAVIAVTADAGHAAVQADGHNPTAVTVPTVVADAGVALVGVDGLNPTATTSASVTAGTAEVTAAAHSVMAVMAGTPDAGTAAVGVDAYNPAALVTYTADAGTATVGTDAHNATTALASIATAGNALVDVSAINPTVSTSSSVTVNVDVASVGVSADNPTQDITQPAGLAAVDSTAYNATAVTVAAGVANAGTAEVAATAHDPAAQPALTATAGQAAVTADGYNASVSTEASYTAQAGVAEVGADGHNPQALTILIAAPGAAEVGAEAYGATVSTAAATEAQALEALAGAQAFNALVIIGVSAGTAEVTAAAFDVPKKRTPGVLVAGTIRSRLTAGTMRGPTYMSGG